MQIQGVPARIPLSSCNQLFRRKTRELHGAIPKDELLAYTYPRFSSGCCWDELDSHAGFLVYPTQVVMIGPNALSMIKIPFLFMSLRVARGVYNPEKERFHFYVSFKPTLDPTDDERNVEGSHSVDVAISVTETGELADVAFSLPEPCRNRRSLEYLSRTLSATLIDEKVFITIPGLNGDSVLQGKGTLELDGAGRIMGLDIH
jgi:hypothetical protein